MQLRVLGHEFIATYNTALKADVPRITGTSPIQRGPDYLSSSLRICTLADWVLLLEVTSRA